MSRYTTGEGQYNPPPTTVQAPSSIAGGYVIAYMNGTVVGTDHFNADGTYHLAGQPEPRWNYTYQPYGSSAILVLDGDAVMLTFTSQYGGTWTSNNGSGTFVFSLTAP